jgi:RNA polymerase sigma-70 factor (ECF subfamily)
VEAQFTSAALPVSAVRSPSERLAALFDAHYGRLYRLSRRLAPTIDDALDLVQETFLKAAKSVNSIPYGAASEEAWLVRVLVNIRRDQWRRKSIQDRNERAASSRATNSESAEDGIIARTAVWAALDVLPPRRRAVLVMYELEGLTIPAISSLLGITAITVRWHLSKGRRELAGVLKNHLGGSHE